MIELLLTTQNLTDKPDLFREPLIYSVLSFRPQGEIL